MPALAARRRDVVVRTAGRPADLLADTGGAGPHRARHARAPQLSGGAEIEAAGLVVGLAPEHVRWVRREHPHGAPKAATLRRQAAALPDGPDDIGARVAATALADSALGDWEEVCAPGGGEIADFTLCASTIEELIEALASRV